MTVSQQIAERALQEHAPMLMAEGEHKKALATARNMLLKGLDAQLVVECTNLSKEEVNELKNDLNGAKH